MTISAIVPVWNGRDLLVRLLATLASQTVPASECIVVDNGSSDGAPEAARADGARVIPMGRNAGFAAAVNCGIREAQSEWIAVLNSDVELAPDYFEQLLSAAEAPAARDLSTAWFATGKILNARRNGLLDGAFDLTCRGGTTWRAGSGQSDSPAFAAPRAIFSPPWTAVLLRKEIFHKVGFLEERFESYLEDVDFGLRCAARGIAGWYVPKAVAWHRGSASLGCWHPAIVRRIARNQLFVVARHLSPRAWWPVLTAQVLWGGLALRHGAAWPWLRGIAEGLRDFSTMRQGYCPDPDVLGRLHNNETLIGQFQGSDYRDTYWRVYFLLTHGGAK
ncbi:MAG TPA: glycosyltransferase family 2 protein [Bryobacteraceae bacterium]|nr:glycosyltransferase family 2 protein [Bryobacteraceae bacterium]